MNIPDAALGALSAAVVSGAITLLGLIVSKENKISEFRQAWIDGVRADFASLISCVTALHTTVCRSGRAEEAWKEARNEVIEINRCAAAIRLRLNPNEEACARLFVALDDFERAFTKLGPLDSNRILALEKSFLLDAQIVLKVEWKRVQAGEVVFRLTQVVALLVVVLGVIYLLFGS